MKVFSFFLFPFVLQINLKQLIDQALGKPSKKVWNFPYFSGVGGFEKNIFHKNKNKKHGLKMHKIA